MDSVRKFSNQVAEAQSHNMQLENNSREMNQQVMFMKEDWKNEQNLVVQQEKDLKLKDEQLEQLEQDNTNLAAMINKLREEI